MKVYGKRSSRKPTSLENLFRTRPAVDTVRHWITDRLIERLTDRQTDRQTDRPTYRQTDQHTDKQTDRPTDRPTYRQTSRQTNKQTNKQTDRQTDQQTDRQTNRQTDRDTNRLANWVGIKEEHGGSEDGSKHSVVKNSGGIHTEKEEGDGACKVDQDGCSSGTTINADPLIGGEEAGGAQCFIPQTGDISCGAACPVGRREEGSFCGMKEVLY